MAGASGSNGKGGRPAPAPVDVGSPLLDWEEGDHFSFEDSERFEEDSLCSWSSEPESLCNNWRGWKRPNPQNPFISRSSKKSVQGMHATHLLSFVSESSPITYALFLMFFCFSHWNKWILCHNFLILLLGYLFLLKVLIRSWYTYLLITCARSYVQRTEQVL